MGATLGMAKHEVAAGFTDSPLLLHQRGLCHVGTPPARLNTASPDPPGAHSPEEEMGATIPGGPEHGCVGRAGSAITGKPPQPCPAAPPLHPQAVPAPHTFPLQRGAAGQGGRRPRALHLPDQPRRALRLHRHLPAERAGGGAAGAERGPLRVRQRRGDPPPPLRHRRPQGMDTFISAFLVAHRRGGPGCRGPPGEGEPLSGRSGTERRAGTGTGAMCRQRSHRPAARSGLWLRGGMAQPSQDHGGPHRSASAQTPGQGGDGEPDTGLPEQRRAGRATARQPLIQQLHPPRGHPHPTHNLNPLPPTLGSALPGRHHCQGPARKPF